MANLTEKDIELASRAAEHFTRLYYSAYDSATRVEDVSAFYRPTSALTWNGNPKQGSDGVRELMMSMPPTKHEVHSFDCHPIFGNQPPSLLVTVSGIVTHGIASTVPNKNVDKQPRVFSQTFMLVPDANAPQTQAGEVAKYYIHADAMRFVG